MINSIRFFTVIAEKSHFKAFKKFNDTARDKDNCSKNYKGSLSEQEKYSSPLITILFKTIKVLLQ